MKKIIFSIFLITLLPSFGFASSWQDWRNWASSKMSNLYSYTPNISQYVSETPAWIGALLKKLSKNQMEALYRALAIALETNVENTIQDTQNQAIKNAAKSRYGFTEGDYSLDGNANNLMLFIAIAYGFEQGQQVDLTTKTLTNISNLFKIYIYPVLEQHVRVDQYMKIEGNNIIITNRENNQKTWNGLIDRIKKHTTLTKDSITTTKNTMESKTYLKTLKQRLDEFIKTNNIQNLNDPAKKLSASLNDAIQFVPATELFSPQQTYVPRPESFDLPSLNPENLKPEDFPTETLREQFKGGVPPLPTKKNLLEYIWEHQQKQ